MEHNYDDFDYTGRSVEAFDSKEIGKRIRLARKMRHISQTKLAEMLDRSLRTIQKYECGDIDVSISALVSICAALDVPLSYIIGLGTRKAVLTSLADVMDFLFLLDTANELDFNIEVEKPPKSQSWKCSLSFGGTGTSAELNPSFCLLLEQWKEQRSKLASGQLSAEDYAAWKDQTITYSSSHELHLPPADGGDEPQAEEPLTEEDIQMVHEFVKSNPGLVAKMKKDKKP